MPHECSNLSISMIYRLNHFHPCSGRMVAQKFGHIVNVASMAAFAPVPGLSLYSASKYAVRAFSLAAAIELREHGVAVTVVCPDAVGDERFGDDGGDRQPRVQGPDGILKHRLETAAKGAHPGRRKLADRMAVEDHGACIRSLQSQQQASECGLSGPRLADETVRASSAEPNGDSVDRHGY